MYSSVSMCMFQLLTKHSGEMEESLNALLHTSSLKFSYSAWLLKPSLVVFFLTTFLLYNTHAQCEYQSINAFCDFGGATYFLKEVWRLKSYPVSHSVIENIV